MRYTRDYEFEQELESVLQELEHELEYEGVEFDDPPEPKWKRVHLTESMMVGDTFFARLSGFDVSDHSSPDPDVQAMHDAMVGQIVQEIKRRTVSPMDLSVPGGIPGCVTLTSIGHADPLEEKDDPDAAFRRADIILRKIVAQLPPANLSRTCINFVHNKGISEPLFPLSRTEIEKHRNRRVIVVVETKDCAENCVRK